MKISDQELAQLIGQRDLQHPSPDDLASLLDQHLPASRREALLEHLERCSQCARAVAVTLQPEGQVASAPESQPQFQPEPQPEPRPKPQPETTRSRAAATSWLPKAMAAAIAVTGIALASVLLLGTDPQPDVLRAADSGLSPAPGAEIVVDSQSPGPEFSWPAPADLSLRQVRLMNEAASTLWVSELRRPPLFMPRQYLQSGTTYLWQLEDADGNVIAGPHWFRIR